MRAFILLAGFFLLMGFSSIKNENQLILQQVLNIEDFNQYISKNPRFLNSQDAAIIMLAHESIDRNAQLTIKQMPVKIMDSTTALLNDKIFYIMIDQFEIQNNKANISLNYKNARLYFEENKQVTLSADLKKINGQWQIDQYNVAEISISDSGFQHK